jgi:hypothetical protein
MAIKTMMIKIDNLFWVLIKFFKELTGLREVGILPLSLFTGAGLSSISKY